MKRQVGFVTKLAVGALLSGAALALPSLQAQSGDLNLPVKAPAAAEPVPYWWFSGSVEVGYRGFLNHPQNGYQTANGPSGTPGMVGDSLAKYYEYSTIKPGFFGNFWLSTGTKDGLYQIDVGGKNVGYSDQSYYLDASKAGLFYFNFVWDQTPHVYSTSAYTPFNLNGNALTLNPCVPPISGGYATARIPASCAQPTDIEIRRDTAAFAGRWTPTDEWDIKADYSHMTRTGTQVSALTGGVSPTSQFLKPVDDLTQNYGVNGEKVAQSPWGQKIVYKLAYSGSAYTDNFSNFTVQSGNSLQVNGARDATWPSNQANAFGGTIAADLPWKSRYVGYLNYTMMRQNDAFMPDSTTQGTIYSGTYYPVYPLPASSLNGAINTLKWNNQLTTKITPELTSKLTYSYYNFQNNTPSLYFGPLSYLDPISHTVKILNGGYNRDYSTSADTVNSLSIAYIKQNAGADLNWRPTKTWNLGAAYGYERYDYTKVDASATNENSGKIYGDWKPYTWFTLRASGSYGVRRADNYDYFGNVGFFQWGPGCSQSASTCDASEIYNNTYRQLMISDRDLWKANITTDLVVARNLTISPMVKYVEAKYGVDPNTQQGLQDSRKWSAGLDVTYLATPNLSFMVGYMYEWGSQLLFGINCAGAVAIAPNPATNCVAPQTLTNDTTTVQTFTAAVRWAAIPDKLDLDARYTWSYGVDNMNFFGSGSGFTNGVPTNLANPSASGQFPQDRTLFQRLDVTATYKFDKEQVAQIGWKGDIKARLHYTWESNSADNWANDPLTPYTLIQNSTLYLGWYNPNYSVSMLSGSVVMSW